MATPGAAWADGVWADGVWADGVWDPDAAAQVGRTGAAQVQALADLAIFLGDVGDVVSDWMGIEMGFAESVFTGATELAGIFTDHSVAGGERYGPRVILKTSDVVDYSIDQGSALTIRTRTFYVRGVQRDGTGISAVILEE